MAAKSKKHDWTQFKLRVFINAKPGKVYKAWTDDKVVSKWFTEKTVIEPRKGGRLYLEWLAGDKLDTKVKQAHKNKNLVLPFVKDGLEVAVTVKKDDKGTICELKQYNMKTDPASKWSIHKGCVQGWTFFLANLKAHHEHRIDLRSHDVKRSHKEVYVSS
ncbi:MAG: SRPBCC domain-containing protein [Candidatus Zixiibacteriota bacterium]